METYIFTIKLDGKVYYSIILYQLMTQEFPRADRQTWMPKQNFPITYHHLSLTEYVIIEYLAYSGIYK